VTATNDTSTPPTTTADLFRERPGWQGSDDDIFGRPADGTAAHHPLRSLLEWLAVIIGALVAAILIKTFLFQAFYIPSGSMRTTLEVGDRVLVNKLAYEFGDVEHGDVIVFHRPESLPPSDIDEFIKRVIGLPGDVLESRDGIVYRNDEPLAETYLAEGTFTNGLVRTTVPAGSVFVMGDNRGESTDSRSFGAVPIDTIVGQAFVRVWPLSNLGGL
jgi:signal peptidase I